MMLILTYSLGWSDIMKNGTLTGEWGKDLKQSFLYYIKWVLPYWWLIILTISTITAAIGVGLRYFVLQLQGNQLKK